MVALGIGAAAGMICYGGVLLKTRLGYDDALDAFGVHGIGGATGSLVTGLFARAVLNNGTGGGLDLLAKQGIAVAAAGAWAALVTFVLLKGIDLVVGLRVEQETEHDGLDGVLHGESAYGSPGGVAHGS
jgi:Amt family ammonium transporter